MNQYMVDNNSNNDVTIEVNVSVPGIVSTRVNKRRPPADFEVIAKSTEPPNSNGKGRIIEKKLAQSKDMNGIEIQVDTVIRLDNIPPSDWEAIFQNLSADYILRGGVNGQIALNVESAEKEKTTTGKTIRVIKEIQFIAIN